MRKLPVTAAGYPLTPRQLTLLVAGSFLALPPWAPVERTPGSEDMARITRLGKLNMMYYCLLSGLCWYTILIVFFLPFPNFFPNNILVWTDFVTTSGFFTMLWIYCKHCLGDAVSLADHGSKVLSVMVQAAEGRANNNRAHQLIEDTIRTLPWLPAYDRRDARCRHSNRGSRNHVR